jgi:hypothetical protein
MRGSTPLPDIQERQEDARPVVGTSGHDPGGDLARPHLRLASPVRPWTSNEFPRGTRTSTSDRM